MIHGFFSDGLLQNLHEVHLGALQPSHFPQRLRFTPDKQHMHKQLTIWL